MALATILYFLGLGALLLDVLGYVDKFEKIFGVDSLFVALTVLVLCILIWYWKEKSTYLKLVKINRYVIFPLFLVLSVVYSVVEFIYPPNVAYSKFFLNSDRLLEVAVFSGVYAVCGYSKKSIVNNSRLIIFLGGLIVLLIGIVVRLWPYDVFKQLSREGGLVENVQFFVLSIGVIASLTYVKKMARHDGMISLFYFILGIGLLFVALEEISWGQRIIQLSSPEYFIKHNTQNETNLHNLSSVGTLVPYAYALIGLLGSFTWEVRNRFKQLQNKRFEFLIPGWWFMPYFYLVFVFNLYIVLGSSVMGEWAEFTEMMLYIGISLFIVSNTVKVNKA